MGGTQSRMAEAREVHPEVHPAETPTAESTRLLEQGLAPILKGVLFPHFNNQSLGRLGRTNRFFHESSKKTLEMRQLLHHVLYGQEAQAKAMIAANSNLLLERATGTTDEGRTYENVTVYEAALYAGDTQMCKMMHEFFDRLSNAEEARVQQYKNVFPKGVDAVEASQTAYDFNVIINAISAASNDDVTAQFNKQENDSALCQAFNTFREAFTRLSKAEKHANLKHLLEAFTLYASDTRLDNWNNDKYDLFWHQIIGFVQRYLPACDKQVFHQGLYQVIENNERLERLEEFKYDPGYSLRLTSDSSGVGFDFAGKAEGTQRGGGWSGGAWVAIWKTYIEQKRQTCRTYAADKSCAWRCDSMT